jgi:hypothetical protein
VSYEFDGTTPQYFRTTGTTITGPPFTVSLWYYDHHTVTTTRWMWSLSDSSVGNHQWMVGSSIGDFAKASIQAGSIVTLTATGVPLNQWNHLCFVEAAANDHQLYANYTQTASSTTSMVPNTPDRFGIGNLVDSTPPTTSSWDGYVAHVAMWNVVLTDPERKALSLGFCPLMIRPQSLIEYHPLIATTQNLVSEGQALTSVNGPTHQEDHPVHFTRPAMPSHHGIVYGQISLPASVDREGPHRRSKWGLRWNTGALPYNPGG